MEYTTYATSYQSPLGPMLLAADEVGLTGLWFCGQKYYKQGLCDDVVMQETAVLAETKHWLDIYFAGEEPDFMPAIHMIGTPFQIAVWQILQQIPRGKTMTYGEIAAQYAAENGLSSMSAQVVGNAVGRNKISIIIPCHRVIGTNGNLTGYAGGIDKKQQLLKLEDVDIHGLFAPTKGSTL